MLRPRLLGLVLPVTEDVILRRRLMLEAGRMQGMPSNDWIEEVAERAGQLRANGIAP